MVYLNVALIALSLFGLTCGLCVIADVLLQFSPFFSVLFLFAGTLGVVLMADILQARLFN
jgi:hypothetical protein